MIVHFRYLYMLNIFTSPKLPKDVYTKTSRSRYTDTGP